MAASFNGKQRSREFAPAFARKQKAAQQRNTERKERKHARSTEILD